MSMGKLITSGQGGFLVTKNKKTFEKLQSFYLEKLIPYKNTRFNARKTK